LSVSQFFEFILRIIPYFAIVQYLSAHPAFCSVLAYSAIHPAPVQTIAQTEPQFHEGYPANHEKECSDNYEGY
jgi:hypothetical protein